MAALGHLVEAGMEREAGEREIRVRLSPADAQWLDGMMSAAGWRDMGTLVASLVHAVVEDDRATESAKPAPTRRAA
jgi:hypothetical protein